jgi:hypothetical protein
MDFPSGSSSFRVDFMPRGRDPELIPGAIQRRWGRPTGRHSCCSAGGKISAAPAFDWVGDPASSARSAAGQHDRPDAPRYRAAGESPDGSVTGPFGRSGCPRSSGFVGAASAGGAAVDR